MPLPIEKYRVYPNPWAHIDPKQGPNGRCPVAMREDFPHVRYVGNVKIGQTPDPERPGSVVTVGRRTAAGPQSPRFVVSITYPTLDAALLKGEPDAVTCYPPDGHYYRDRLIDGSLVPADEATLRAVPEAMFKSLADAKAKAVEKFDSELGEGSWAELERLLGMPSSESTIQARRAGKQEGNS